MAVVVTQAEVLALAVYEIRRLLASEVGPSGETPAHIRHAAHLAYAIHNEALAVLAGEGFDATDALARLIYADTLVGADGFTLRILNECRGPAET